MPSRSKVQSAGLENRNEPTINMQVKVVPTGEMFPLRRIPLDMKISDLKSHMEFVTGVPINFQRVHYLDEGDLINEMEVRQYDFVPGAVLYMDVWNTHRDLFTYAAKGELEEVYRIGVTQDSTYNTPSSLYMRPKQRQKWLHDRAFLALFVATHRGHHRLCEKLIETGVEINGRSPLGRTPLHVVAARGHSDIVDLLLDKGADINAVDDHEKSALDVAGQFGHKACERHLFLFRWQVRARKTRAKYLDPPLMAHQYSDSAYPVWRAGRTQQVYYHCLLPPGEFQGSAINAPKSKTIAERDHFRKHGSLPDLSPRGTQSAVNIREKKKNRVDFETWLNTKQRYEQIQINRKKAEEARKKEEEEDKKRADEEQQESYEIWLARQQGIDIPQKKEATGRRRGRRLGRQAARAAHKEREAQQLVAERAAAAESLAREQRLKTERERSIYEDWLQEHSNKMINDIVRDAHVLDTPRLVKAT